MLGKLLKYEIRAMGRVMLPLYLAMIFVAGLFAFNMKVGMSAGARRLLQQFAIITGVLFFAAVMAVFIVMFIMVVQRFYKNLLGTEGYLMFTLPVNTFEHIASKAVSSMLWILVGFVAGACAGFLMIFMVSDVPEFLREMKSAFDMVFGSGIPVGRIVMIVLLIILAILESLCQIYAAISVGHQFNSHRLLFSIIAYIAFGIAEIAISSIPFIRRFVGRGIYLASVTAGQANFSILQEAPAFVVLLIGIAVYGIITWYLLDRRLNLE